MNKNFIKTLSLSALLTIGFAGAISAKECMILEDPEKCHECCSGLYSAPFNNCSNICWQRKPEFMKSCGDDCVDKFTKKYTGCYNHCMGTSSAISGK